MLDWSCGHTLVIKAIRWREWIEEIVRQIRSAWWRRYECEKNTRLESLGQTERKFWEKYPSQKGTPWGCPRNMFAIPWPTWLIMTDSRGLSRETRSARVRGWISLEVGTPIQRTGWISLFAVSVLEMPRVSKPAISVVALPQGIGAPSKPMT